MDEFRVWLTERAAGVALLAVVLVLAVVGRRERRY